MIQNRAFPSAFIVDVIRLFNYKELLRNLVAKDLKVKYRGSVLGFVWSLLNPLLMIVVYTIVFGLFMRVKVSQEHYPLFLVVGILHWVFFASSFLAATEAILGNANLVRKIDFPRMILPVSAVTFQFIQLLFALGVFALAYPFLGGKFWLGLLLYPVVLALQGLMVSGIALVISALTVYYRDLKHLSEVGLVILFWLTPIAYEFTMIPLLTRLWLRLNPMMTFVIVYQDLFYYHTWPSLASWALMIFWAAGTLGLGYMIFQRLEDRFAEEL